MGLSKKDTAGIINRYLTNFYMNKDKATSADLIKFIYQLADAKCSAGALLPIIKTISEHKLDILTEEVKYEILYKIGVASNQYIYLQQIVSMFRSYNIPISETISNKLITECLASPESKADKDCHIWCVINCLQPKFTKQTIENILADSLFKYQSQMLKYILNQLIADKDFQSILGNKDLFDYAVKNKRETAMQVVKNLIDAKQLDIIAEQSNKYSLSENGVLFSDDLIKQMIGACLKEHKTELIFDTKQVFDYIDSAPIKNLVRKALQQLKDDNKHSYIATSPEVLSCIIKYGPDFEKSIFFKKAALESVKKEQACDLLGLMQLPNADMEFVYIKRNNSADAKFPAKEKLSPETRDYIDIITGKYENTALFKKLTPRVISALIDCHFDNQVDWYKIMEQILIANPNLDTKFVQQMLNKDKKVIVLIKKHWKGGFRKVRIKRFISEKKQAFMNFFGVNQNKR